MNGLLEKFGFTEKKYNLFTFDVSLQKMFGKKIGLALAMLGASIALFIIQGWVDGLIALIVTLGFSAYLYYQYLYFCYEKFDYVIGECNSISQVSKEIGKRKVYNKRTLTLFSDGIYYNVLIRPNDEIEKGSKVIVYMPKTALSEINENTYEIDNPFTYTILSHPTT